MVKYFDLVLFNFLFSNGDAHLKNFSVVKNTGGDYKLAPAYDLIDTQIHLPGDSIFALQKGLFADGRQFPLGIGYSTFSGTAGASSVYLFSNKDALAGRSQNCARRGGSRHKSVFPKAYLCAKH